ncbi:hypothetical protein Mth01_56570 [Sphaerimonospora thailandensis]|uniref:Anti-sigma regulatory factor (Ser/Thr protein kinase) n=2 Tax=Sphaerimonospora thailandensis TaxID=795644 RepID=A0A8J3RGR4_9ACTN|nr:hypothetical protein Mth01_56570 [Sphaerimonospora thailandensis]
MTEEHSMMNCPTIDGAAVVATAPPFKNMYTCELPHVPEGVGTVRRCAQGVLAAWGIPAAAAQEALLAISDLVTDSVMHGLPPAELRLSLRRDGVRTVVRVEIVETETALAPVWPGVAPRRDVLGCGSALVKALAVRYGTDSRAGAVTRWADLPAF